MAKLAFVTPDLGSPVPSLLARVADAMQTLPLSRDHSLQMVSAIAEDAEAVLAACDLPVFEIAEDPGRYRKAYELAVGRPGVVVLLDTDIGRLVASLVEEGSGLGEEATKEARVAVSQVLAASGEWDRSVPLPWCARLARRARAVVVQEPSDAEYLRSFRCRTPVHVVLARARRTEGGPADGGEQAAMAERAGDDASYEEFARTLRRAVDETVELLADPVRKALAGWARALADCGGTVDGFRAGYGARYADGLESLSAPPRSGRRPLLPRPARGLWPASLSPRTRGRRGA